MASAFLAGCGVAAGAYALKGAINVGKQLQANPEAAKQIGALGAGIRGMGNAFKVPDFVANVLSNRKHAGGFDAAINRREAGLILGISERSTKDEIKKAHRKMMLLNHPDRGGSPFLATKINEASECLSGQSKSSGSAFS
tara:strand:+ start:65 stop:484 length:420 start_codon:yes stop_codon:yes gene_type:complete